MTTDSPKEIHHHHYTSSPTPDTAMLLELLPGFFIQTFGIGNIYAGNVATGLFFMFGYWILSFVNLVLCFILIGFLTWPITFIAFMYFSTVSARNEAQRKLDQEISRS